MEEGSLKEEETKEGRVLPYSVLVKKLARKDADQVFKNGGKYSSSQITLFLSRNESEKVRLTIRTRRQVGIAVQRNRIKRLIRESIHQQKDLFKGYDFIVIPKKPLAELGFHQVSSLVKNIFEKISKR